MERIHLPRHASLRERLLTRIDNILLSAGLTAAAGGTLAAPQSADASVHHVTNAHINIPSTNSGVYLVCPTDAHGSPGIAVPGWDVNAYGTAGLGLFSPPALGGGAYVTASPGDTAALNLAFGTPIGNSNSYGDNSPSPGASQTQWNLGSSNNLIGIRFFNESTSQIHFGWMRIDFAAGGTAVQPREIVEYACEGVSGVPIGAGVPEPSSLALLALGLVGLRRRRSRAND